MYSIIALKRIFVFRFIVRIRNFWDWALKCLGFTDFKVQGLGLAGQDCSQVSAFRICRV